MSALDEVRAIGERAQIRLDRIWACLSQRRGGSACWWGVANAGGVYWRDLEPC
jgi:hypothetical protein